VYRFGFTALALRPLTAARTRELIDRLLGAEGKEAAVGTAALRERIVERSGGNPFFVIELARSVREQSSAAVNANASLGAGAASATRTMGAGQDLTLPDTVHAAVLARIDQLAAPERAVLQAASVVGRVFRLATIQVLVAPTTPNGAPDDGAPDDGASAAITGALDALLQRDLVVPAETGAFAFRHMLIRDVAYGTLSRGERIRMHTAVAAWLEQFALDRLDEFAALLAYHYREAYGQLHRTGHAHVRWSYLYVLHLASAREDCALADEAAHVIERMHEGQDIPLGRVFLSVVAAYRQDDPRLLDLDPADYLLMSPSEVVLWFLCERGALTPASLLEEVRAQAQTLNWGGLLRYVRVAEALASGDNARLAVAIEEAEAGQLVSHAARMRIVLAPHTGDRAQLERSRPVLERLGDRQFLRRLEEVEGALT
jgi:hypothetical protein